MAPELHDGEFVFCVVPASSLNDRWARAVAVFREREGVTLILSRGEAEALGLDSSFPSRMITLSIQSSLSEVGLLAAITHVLAEHGISVNAFSAYHHDHLFVPVDRAQEAMELLKALKWRP